MYPLAVRAGVGADDYWDMTLKEVVIQVEANRLRHMDALRERGIMDHKLSELIAFAMNEPNKMPSIQKMYGFLNYDDPTEAQPKEAVPEWQQDRLEFMKQAEAIRAARNAKQGGES